MILMLQFYDVFTILWNPIRDQEGIFGLEKVLLL